MKQTGASEHQRLASDPRVNVWVAANAGSGKTRVLVERVIRLLLDGVDPQRILCLTFTKAAASEMANRLFDVLGKWITCDDSELGRRLSALGIGRVDKALLSRARKLFTLSLETPGGLKIQTIHAFAERLLQLFPIEANVAPGFEVMDERAAGELLETARRSVLAAGAQSHSAALGKIISFVEEDSFDSLIETILSKRSDLSHVLRAPNGVEDAIAALRSALGRPAGLTKDDVTSFLSIDRAQYRALTDALRQGKPSDQQRASLIVKALAQPDATLNVLARLYLKTDHQPKTLRSIATNAVVTIAPWIPAFVASEQQRLSEANEARSDLAMLEATEALLHLAAEIIGRYETEKRNSGRYDFEDLIARTGQLLTRSGAAQWVLYKLDGGIDHILIDEAQDTSPAQWTIVEALAEEFYAGGGARADVERTFFAVGDRKQSIFSFQGADPDAFVEAAARFELKVAGVGKTFKRIPLYISYRSTKWVLDAVDCVFAMPAARQGIEAQLDISIEHRPHRQEDHGLVELWPLVTADEKIEEQPWRAPSDAEPQNHPRRKLAAKIARRVASWIGRRRLPSQNRTVRAGDILILVQRRNAFFDAVIRELRRHGVAVAGADRIKLGEHLAVRDVLALAQFALLPDDDYTLACVLKSPLVSRDDGTPIDDADLFDLAHNRGKISLWQRLLDDPGPRFNAARDFLERWLTEGPSLSPFEFISRLLVQSRADILSRLGPEANDPLDALIDLALEFERDHPPTLQAFLSWFASDETEIKRDMDQGADEVRVMTVHGAKGLESNIVILPDCSDLPDNRPRSPVIMVRTTQDGPEIPFWVLPKMVKSSTVQGWCARRLDVAGDEYRRLLYVAMTRARDEVYVCGWYNRIVPKDHCWYELIRSALTPNARHYVDADGDTLWRIGKDDEFTAAKDAQMAFGGLLPTWLRQPLPEPPRARQVRPSSPVRAPLTPDLEQRIARGRLVHRLLEVLPELPAEAQLPTALALAKQEPGGADLAAALVRIIQDPHYVPYFTAPGLTEVPIMMRDQDGQLVSGQIDRLLVSDHEALIIDYKSDARPPDAPEQVNSSYIAQLASYRAAVRLIFPGRKVRAALLWTEGPRLMEVPEALLDRAAMQETRILAAGGEP